MRFAGIEIQITLLNDEYSPLSGGYSLPSNENALHFSLFICELPAKNHNNNEKKESREKIECYTKPERKADRNSENE